MPAIASVFNQPQGVVMSKIAVLTAVTLLGLAACNEAKQNTSQSTAVQAAPVAANAAPAVAVEAAPKPAMQTASEVKPLAPAKTVEVSPKVETQPVSEVNPAAPASKPQTPLAKSEVREAQPAKVAVITQEQAMALARSGNCFACHKIDSGLVGPAWKAVAAKYKDDVNAASTIANHIKAGGSFGWRMSIMPPRGGSKISDADVESLAKFIASLR